MQESAEELLVECDGAMYEAKAKGRNTQAVHERAGGALRGLTERHSWLGRLRRALEEDMFELSRSTAYGEGFPSAGPSR